MTITKFENTNCDRFRTLKHSTVTPYVFTEQGVAMLSTVPNSDYFPDRSTGRMP